jgi:hypothetical protein
MENKVEDQMKEDNDNTITIPTLNPTQNQYYQRNLENNILKLHANYKTLLKKSSSMISATTIGKHEELQIETATQNIVSIFLSLFLAFLFFPFFDSSVPCSLFMQISC